MSEFRPPEQTVLCRRCGNALDSGATLCTRCGTFVSSGVNVQAVERVKTAGRLGLALVLSASAAVVGGVIWASLVAWLSVEVGYVAWGIGLLAGGAIALTTKERGMTTGLAAVGFALMGLLVGKALTISMVSDATMSTEVLKELSKDPDFMVGLVLYQMAEKGELEADVAAYLQTDDDAEPSKELLPKVEKALQEARARFQRMSTAEKKVLIQPVIKAGLEEITLWDRIAPRLSPWDLVWVALAVGTAWKIGSASPD
jgi:hypothetical protein